MTQKILIPVFFTIALLCIIYPWLFIQGQYIVNGNISWLLMAAERLLSGQDFVQNIYETNPPLSILIYTPHVMLAKILGMPLTVASFYVTSCLVILSSLSVYSIIRKFDHLNEFDKTTFILAHFIAITLATSVFFSDREHFIILALIPFVLCQYALTERIKINNILLWSVMVIGATCILIKPHYGLIPTVFLIHRAINHRTLKIVIHPDFIALAVMTLLYIAITAIFFPGFITTILPDVLKLYVNTGYDAAQVLNISKIHMILYSGLLIFDLVSDDIEKRKRRLLISLQISCLLCMVPYFVQMKGFYNHLIPAYAFFIIALSSSICFRLSNASKKTAWLAMIIPLIVSASSIEIISPLNKSIPKQSEVPNLPVSRFLEKNCEHPCTFFAFHGDIEIFNPTAARMGYTHASRFPSFWFLPEILKHPEKHNKLKEKYLEYVAEDLEYYKPSIILLTKDLPIGPYTFNFLEYFDANTKIKNIFEENYTKIDDFEFDRAEYFRGTSLGKSLILKFDVYKLNP